MCISLLVAQANCQPREIHYSVRWKQREKEEEEGEEEMRDPTLEEEEEDIRKGSRRAVKIHDVLLTSIVLFFLNYISFKKIICQHAWSCEKQLLGNSWHQDGRHSADLVSLCLMI